MSGAKHTPGPWRVGDIGANCLFIKGGVHVEASATPYQREYYSNLATVTQRDPHPHLDGGIPRDVTAANALLISAAPELLAALQGVLRVADRATVEFDAARAAIAKATGVQHG